MPTFAANVSMLFTELPFLQRFAAARAAGFEWVEFQWPYAHRAAEVARVISDTGLRVSLFNLPAGDVAAGERGLAALPDRADDFARALDVALEYASMIRPLAMNCLCGCRDTRYELHAQMDTLRERASQSAHALGMQNVRMVLEFLNPWDAPGFLLPQPDQMFALVRALDHANIRVQYDLYHAQRQRGALIETLRSQREWIGHIQFADTPGRHEPGTGEINFANVFRALDECGYTGPVGAEYIPSTTTAASLAWWHALRPA